MSFAARFLFSRRDSLSNESDISYCECELKCLSLFSIAFCEDSGEQLTRAFCILEPSRPWGILRPILRINVVVERLMIWSGMVMR